MKNNLFDVNGCENNIQRFSGGVVYFTAFVSPFLALFAGLSLALVFVLTAIGPLALFIKSGQGRYLFNSNTYRIVLIFLLYSLLSCLWAIDPEESFDLWYRLVLLFIGFVALFEFVPSINYEKRELVAKILLAGVVLGLLGANVEIITDGFLTKFFRGLEGKGHVYELVDLNRGASYLSIIFWPPFAYLLFKGRKLGAFALLVAFLVTLARLESQSSYVSLMLSSLVFLFVCITGRKGINFIMIVAVLSIVGVAMVAKSVDPGQIYKVIPKVTNSASEVRLYIWEFAANKASIKPWFGWGFNASRSIPVQESDYVLNHRHPLPLHPHNNVLQLWLELGIVGLILFGAFLLSIMGRVRGMSLFEATHCSLHPVLDVNKNKYSYSILHKLRDQVRQNLVMALFMGLICTYFIIGEIGYGMWQNWWVSAGLLSLCFLRLVSCQR